MKNIMIDKKKIGPDRPPFIIAEMSGNHNHSLQRALLIVEAAAKAGVHALKLQTYTADTMTLDLPGGDFFIKDKKSLWRGRSLYDLYKKAYTPWEWHKPIFDRCRKLGIIGFSTPFDVSAVDFLESLNVPCYKIASFELVDIPLIKRVAKLRKPLIMSTGMASIREIKEAVSAARLAGAKDIVLLKCTSSYPASPVSSNLATLPDMAKRFHCQVGVSDHTLGIGAALAGIALGASVIEKHFILRRVDGGVDSAFSMEPEEMTQLVTESMAAWQARGRPCYGASAEETRSMVFRRSIYVAKDMERGEVFTGENVRVIRPGYGLAPRYYEEVIGRRINKAAKMGTPLTRGMIKQAKQ
jgi:pseudaminic acid synthase